MAHEVMPVGLHEESHVCFDVEHRATISYMTTNTSWACIFVFYGLEKTKSIDEPTRAVSASLFRIEFRFERSSGFEFSLGKLREVGHD